MRINVKRQFNYTERAKIPRNAVKLRTLSLPGGPPRVIIEDFGLSQIKVAHDSEEWLSAQVILEANRHTTSSFARLSAGLVGEVLSRPGPQFSATLEEFDTDENIVFTVKVVSRSAGLLLAEAKNVRVADDSAQRHELLPVQEYDLGQEPWRLHWEDGVGPIIQVNKRILGTDNFLTRDAFMQGAVIPAALRMVLLRLLQDRELREEPWAKQWLQYASEHASSEPPVGEDGQNAEWLDIERWVNELLSAFSVHFQFTDKINELIQGPAED